MKYVLLSAFLLALAASSHGEACGRHLEKLFREETYIVGGVRVDMPDSVVSFQVFKSDEVWNEHVWKHVCGGILLNNRWVLTAAHCAKEFREWGTARVSIGSVNLNETRGAQIIKVRRVIEHPRWNSEGPAWDIALIELQRSVRFNYETSPACLNRNKNSIIEDESCAAVGWGRVEENADFSDSLQVVHVDVLNHQQCKKAYSNLNGVRITDNHICAGRLGESGKGICQGDLGGPLFCKTEDGVELVGVATNGAMCGSAQHPGVYIRVDEFIYWIRQTTRDWSIGERDSTAEYPTSTDDYWGTTPYWRWRRTTWYR